MAKNIKSICWHVTLFLILNPIISIALLVPYLIFSSGYSATTLGWNILFASIFAVLTNLSITMGYHRLFAHKSYEAHPILEAILLFIGAGAFQGSALKWASDHRVHHRFEDTEKDPYSIKKGFWYAHMGWMMKNESVSLPIQAPDLQKNKLIAFQHNHYLISAIVVGYLLPMAIGALFGNALFGLVIGGGLRIFLTQQSTFFVNSLSHTLGKTPYSLDKTAKDSIVVAFLTHGEGYHNFHHKFQFDYRNGIRWYHWDPTKWSIQLAYLTGLAKKLKTVHFSEIIKARLQVESDNFKNSQFYADRLEPIFEKIVQSQQKFEQLKMEYKTNGTDKIASVKADMKLAKIEFDANMKKWKVLVKAFNSSPYADS